MSLQLCIARHIVGIFSTRGSIFQKLMTFGDISVRCQHLILLRSESGHCEARVDYYSKLGLVALVVIKVFAELSFLSFRMLFK